MGPNSSKRIVSPNLMEGMLALGSDSGNKGTSPCSDEVAADAAEVAAVPSPEDAIMKLSAKPTPKNTRRDKYRCILRQRDVDFREKTVDTSSIDPKSKQNLRPSEQPIQSDHTSPLSIWTNPSTVRYKQSRQPCIFLQHQQP